MAQNAELQLLTLTGVAHRCTQETELFFRRQRYDPRYCFELFRRAFVGRDQRAWDLIYIQYKPLVAGWVDRHTAFPASGEEVQYFVNRAFEKMWSALTPQKFVGFSDLSALLRYLQVCVHSAVVDRARKAELATVSLEDEIQAVGNTVGQGSAQANLLDAHPLDGHPLDGMYRQELWQALSARLQDDRERIVIYASFVLGLKPRELQRRAPDQFRDVKEIYRIKENVIARLRRDAEFLKILSGDA